MAAHPEVLRRQEPPDESSVYPVLHEQTPPDEVPLAGAADWVPAMLEQRSGGGGGGGGVTTRMQSQNALLPLEQYPPAPGRTPPGEDILAMACMLVRPWEAAAVTNMSNGGPGQAEVGSWHQYSDEYGALVQSAKPKSMPPMGSQFRMMRTVLGMLSVPQKAVAGLHVPAEVSMEYPGLQEQTPPEAVELAGTDVCVPAMLEQRSGSGGGGGGGGGGGIVPLHKGRLTW